jgi:hypothetical protein
MDASPYCCDAQGKGISGSVRLFFEQGMWWSDRALWLQRVPAIARGRFVLLNS